MLKDTINAVKNTPAINVPVELIEELLACSDASDCEQIRKAAFDLTTDIIGNNVYYRGIIEFSNICTLNCNYCGIRKDNEGVNRYQLTSDEIVESALWCANAGYGSIVMQSGERRDEEFISFLEKTIRRIKSESISPNLPEGVGITLSVGEQSFESYKRLFNAGAHRYLLRIESSNESLFSDIHPKNQLFSTRKEALKDLANAGFQVGTGVMIGLPSQTLLMLANDIKFFASMNIDMIGMGPYIVHESSPMKPLGMMEKSRLLQLSLNMIAVTRLTLKNVNIAATTALQALVPNGRELGISYGANVTMPNITPQTVRKNYQLYEGKPCIDEGRLECKGCLENRVKTAGRAVGWNKWGDSPHFENK